MADNLPLIPHKRGELCGDVRPVLREVFKEIDILPPLSPETKTLDPLTDVRDTPLANGTWIERYDCDCEDVWQQEGELKLKFAKRIARDPLPNIYKLYDSPKQTKTSKVPASRVKSGLGFLERKDLKLSPVQNAVANECLWVRNILTRSSGDLTSAVPKQSKKQFSVDLSTPREYTLASLSMGEVASRPQKKTGSVPPERSVQDAVRCVPPELEFVNFTVGHLYTKSIRVVNTSASEVRMSLRPPRRRDLQLQLGARGLALSAGAETDLRVHFRPVEVRAVYDVVEVRTSSGQHLRVTICCYMQPPFLDILVPALSSSALWCTPAGGARGVLLTGDTVDLGARLLGDPHHAQLQFYCDLPHARFFIVPEDSWLQCTLCVVGAASGGWVQAERFWVSPAWWRGGGLVRGSVRCRALCAGLHTAALRLVSSTAVVRPLTLLADALHFNPDHVTIVAAEKDYDICSDDDPACQHYVHLGTAFPDRPLTATVRLVNRSPIAYSYYWVAREWGECRCWAERSDMAAEDSDLCAGAREQRDKEAVSGSLAAPAAVGLLHVEPSCSSMDARATSIVHVCVPRAGTELGVQRAVIMLVVKDVPKDSFLDDLSAMIIKTDVVDAEEIPGVESWSREVCDVVCAQLEVWWEVVPVRLVLDPPLQRIHYSRRISSVEVCVRATQLFGSEGVSCDWRLPLAPGPPPPPSAPLALTAAHSCQRAVLCPLPALPNHFPDTEVIALEASGWSSRASCGVERQCDTRHPAVRPACVWLGVVPPATDLCARLRVLNDTHQHICWWSCAHQYLAAEAACAACAAACRHGGRPPCACAALVPARGALHRGGHEDLLYKLHAPKTDGCVARLVRVQRTSADVARVPPGAPPTARAALVAFRVLAPRLVLRARSCCAQDKLAGCECCPLDEGGGGGAARGDTAVLRPRRALDAGRRTCYRVLVSNLTPQPTTLTWETPPEEDVLKLIFFPKEFIVGSYGKIEISVVVEARRVSVRRLHVVRACVRHAAQPLYLVLDVAVSGLEVICELPLGGADQTESTLTVRRTQVAGSGARWCVQVQWVAEHRRSLSLVHAPTCCVAAFTR